MEAVGGLMGPARAPVGMREDRLGLAVDGIAIGAVAGLLVAIHYLLPPGVRDGFAFRYAEPDPFHALTGAFVHLTTAHLRGNVIGLLAGGGWTLMLSWLADERRWFRLSFLAYLTVVPVAVSFTWAWLLGESLTTRGFSGVVSSFAGFGLVGVAIVLHRVYGVDRWLAWDAVAALVMVLGGEILWLVTGSITPVFAGLLAIGLALMLLPPVRAAVRAGWPQAPDEWQRLGLALLTTGLLGALVLLFAVGLFPRDFASGRSVTNILGHYLGIVYGAVVAAWGYRYWSAE